LVALPRDPFMFELGVDLLHYSDGLCQTH
jgi:hypothetical protein